MNVKEYIDELCGQIRDKHAREFVEDEIRSHIEDQAEAFEKDGMRHEDALAKAVKEMGDPVSVGVELDRIHRPHMEWRFLGYVVFISMISLGVQFLIRNHMSIGTEMAGSFERSNILPILFGLAIMIVIYRADYTILAGRCRISGACYLILLTLIANILSVINSWLYIGTLSISLPALLILYLPLFAGILYEYRGGGRTAVAKIAGWIIAPVACQFSGYFSIPTALFFLIAETTLFLLALLKNWYQVDKKAVTISAIGSLFAGMVWGIVSLWRFNGYQSQRLLNWLARYGIGSHASGDYEGINYVNGKLDSVFSQSMHLGKSVEAMNIMKAVPRGYNNDLILGSISAVCGKMAVAGIILCLLVLSIYVLRISLRQNNSFGYIIGCSCGITIGLQSISNILIVFGILPLTSTVLPFFASGFTYSFVDYALLGLILSIYRYKDIRKEKAIMHKKTRWRLRLELVRDEGRMEEKV